MNTLIFIKTDPKQIIHFQLSSKSKKTKVYSVEAKQMKVITMTHQKFLKLKREVK
jgi:hypothetical protein